MELNSKQTRYLRSLAHHLSPAVQMGKSGFTPAIVKEVDRNLADHELIKVRIAAEDREQLSELADSLAHETDAALVQLIGSIAVYYRPAEEPEIKLPRK
jgi:RNA-binding protein